MEEARELDTSLIIQAEGRTRRSTARQTMYTRDANVAAPAAVVQNDAAAPATSSGLDGPDVDVAPAKLASLNRIVDSDSADE